MKNIKEKIEASIMLASYLETVGFKNGVWEFNYKMPVSSINMYTSMMSTMLHHYMILGGNMIDITNFNSSDDTIMIIATADAVIAGGGYDNYKKYYLDSYDLLIDEKRASGITTIDSLEKIKKNIHIKSDSSMGGNGAAMRTGPIGLMWYDDYEKVIMESIIASKITHNYYIGILGGMITALFTSFAMKNIKPWLWVETLLELYKKGLIHKYYENISELDEYMSYWKRYQETRISKLKYKNSLDFFIYTEDRANYLLGFNPSSKIKALVVKGQRLDKLNNEWGRIGTTGLDACIYAYDCLLMCMNSDGTKTLDFDNITYNFNTFMTLVSIHPGDSDTTAAIGGTWFGALVGFDIFDVSNLKKLEFYEELKKVSNKIIKSRNLN